MEPEASQGQLGAEGDCGMLSLLLPSPQSEAVTHEMEELSLHPTQNLPPLNERKNGEDVLLHEPIKTCKDWRFIKQATIIKVTKKDLYFYLYLFLLLKTKEVPLIRVFKRHLVKKKRVKLAILD